MRNGLAPTPVVKKHKPEEITQQDLDDFDNYLQRFVIENFNQEDYEQIRWQEFQQNLREYLRKCLTYHQSSSQKNEFETAQYLAYEGALHVLNQEHDQALSCFLTAINTYPNFLLVHFWLIETYHRLQRHADIIQHIDKFNLLQKETGTKYADAIYLHLSLFSAEQIQENFLHYAHPVYYPSEVLFYYSLAKRALNQFNEGMQNHVYFLRANHCFFNNAANLTLYNLNRISDKNYQHLFCQIMAELVSGNYQSALDDLLPRLLTSEASESIKTDAIKIGADLCLEFRTFSRARYFLSRARNPNLAGTKKIEFIILEIKLLITEKNPYWPMLEELLKEFRQCYKTLAKTEQDNFDFLETLVSLLNQCIALYHRNKETKNVINITEYFLNFYDELLSDLETHKNPSGSFLNLSCDRLYVRYLKIIIKFYTWFPETAALDPLSLIKSQIIERYLAIPNKLASCQSAQIFSKELIHFCDIAETVTNREATIAEDLKTKYPSLTEQSEQPHAAMNENDDEKADSAKDLPIEHAASDTFHLYEFHFETLLDLLRAKRNSFTYKDLPQHYDRIMQSKNMAAFDTIHDLFHPLNMNLLELEINFDQCLLEKKIDEIKSIGLSLFQCIHLIVVKLNQIQTLLNGAFPDQLALLYLKESLVKTAQSFYIRYLTDLNRYLTLLLENADIEAMTKAYQWQEKFKSLHDLCFDEEFDDDPEIRKKLQIAYNDSLNLKEKFHYTNTAQLENRIINTQSSHANHSLDVFYGEKLQIYTVPFPAYLLVVAIKNIFEHVKTDKNISAHVLTLVFSLPAKTPQETPKTRHLHLPLKLSTDQPSPVIGIAEAGNKVANMSENILQRIGRGIAFAEDHRASSNSCNIVPPYTPPKKIDPPLHMHSEQHFYAWLSSQNPAYFLNQINALPGGNEFRQGITVEMIALDMASVRTCCQSCRLSTLSVQNHASEFPAKFAEFLKGAGFIIANNVLKSVTRVLATRDNSIDPPSAKHHNPKERNVSLLHNCSIFEYKHPNVFVSGASHKAFERNAM